MGSRSNLAPPQGAAAPPPSSPMPAAPAQPGPSLASMPAAGTNPGTLQDAVHSGSWPSPLEAMSTSEAVQFFNSDAGFGGGGMQATAGPDGNIQVGAGILQPQMFPMNGGGTGIAPPAPGAGVAKCPTCGK